MAGFSGATGVPLKQMQDAIAQSTAIVYGVGTNIPSNSNFNNYTSPGAYSVASQAIAESITNIPYRQAGRLEVRGTLSTYIIQYYYPYINVNRFYMRRYTNAWSDWYEYDDATQLDPTYDVGNTYTVGVVFGPGYVTSGSTDIYFMFDVPRRPNSNATLTVTSCKLVIRGINGYVDVFTNAATENISTSGFTYSLSYKSNRQMELFIKKSSALTNVTNNTPILANGSISFRVS